MATDAWITKKVSVINLHLDTKNPRLGRETQTQAPRDIIQYLFQHDKALEIADSIATRGFFPNESLLAVKEKNKIVVVEGNRRLAALKALREPGLLEPPNRKKIERLARKITAPEALAKVPVTIAPNRRSTDRQIAGRHIATPVLAWQAENRASFILEKLEEGYDNDELRDELGFTLQDIQKARQTRAIADMARSLDLSDEVKAKLDNPRAKIFTTVERVMRSTVGREKLRFDSDNDYGLKGNTTKNEFVKGFKKLITDVATNKEDSRSLNNNEDIENYFNKWDSKDLPAKKRGTFVPSDIITGKSVSAAGLPTAKKTTTKKAKTLSKTILPKDFRVRAGSDRLTDIRNELIKLKRDDFPNAGAVLLRVFLELAITDYLDRTGELQQLITTLKDKNKLRHSVPEMKQMVPSILKKAKANLKEGEVTRVTKALRYDKAAPFTISDMHSFVHDVAELPGPQDIRQFWYRTEPLFRMMLEQELEEDSK